MTDSTPAPLPGNPSAFQRVLIVGIGSPHGEDRAGWNVIEQVAELLSPCAGIELRQAVVPHDILDWLKPDTTTHMVDASLLDSSSAVHHSRVERLEITGDSQNPLQVALIDACSPSTIEVAFSTLRSNSTHQLDLLSVLELAAALNRLPPRLVLWTIPINPTTQEHELSSTTAEHVVACAQCIVEELS